jgi:hypothetical protein
LEPSAKAVAINRTLPVEKFLDRHRALSAYRVGPLSRPRLRRALRFEGKNATQRSRTSPSTNDFANQRALEEAGIEFVENGGAEGVRLKKPSA